MLCSSCEDTQKKTIKITENSASDLQKRETKEKVAETKIQEESSQPPVSGKNTFKLTNKNMKAFLLDYGKENKETKVRLTTRFGEIDIQLFKATPLHRANFIYLTKQNYFDETFFYRVAKNFVIQGGNSDRDKMARKRFEIGDDYTIPQEQIKGKTHQRGSVALSKQWVDNPSNRSTPFEFFIVVAKNGAHHLDGEHTIFGEVIKGMEVVDKISNVPVDGSEWPLENIFIKAEVIE